MFRPDTFLSKHDKIIDLKVVYLLSACAKVLFFGASMDQVDVMRDCLDSFCLSGG